MEQVANDMMRKCVDVVVQRLARVSGQLPGAAWPHQPETGEYGGSVAGGGPGERQRAIPVISEYYMSTFTTRD